MQGKRYYKKRDAALAAAYKRHNGSVERRFSAAGSAISWPCANQYDATISAYRGAHEKKRDGFCRRRDAKYDEKCIVMTGKLVYNGHINRY